MFAVAAAISSAVALVLDLAGISRGHFDPETFTIAGLLCLALAVLSPGWPRRP
jgi:hypothetical protein